MLRTIRFAVGPTATLARGGRQLAGPVLADPPSGHCAAVLCIQCPPGFELSPTRGNCCRCVKIR